VYYRSPTALARSAADVDRLSNGRLVLGVGAGWDQRELEQLGIPFPPNAERLAALDETIQFMDRLLRVSPSCDHLGLRWSMTRRRYDRFI
jgi:alkanesulfonate monooxygenase SsuD/methylene tetrahydromethanopterin reductase-like flavin-dependent oxidoreductase (luciferase family)